MPNPIEEPVGSLFVGECERGTDPAYHPSRHAGSGDRHAGREAVAGRSMDCLREHRRYLEIRTDGSGLTPVFKDLDRGDPNPGQRRLEQGARLGRRALTARLRARLRPFAGATSRCRSDEVRSRY